MDPETVPNHHAGQRGFSGPMGLFAALTLTVGRKPDAVLACRLTGAGAGDAVIDIGCGPGVAARHAAALGATVVGVDPAPVMIRAATLFTRTRRVRYVTGAAESLPVADGAATVAWSLATVHHWAVVDAGLAEVRRALAAGGRFVALEKRTRRGATGLASHGWTRGQADVFAGMLAQAGFVDVAVAVHEGRRTTLSVRAVRG